MTAALPARAALQFGQFGAAADPINLPHFRDRLEAAGIECILVEHFDGQKVYDFLHNYSGKIALFGSSLGAGAIVVNAGYLKDQPIALIGGFQPSDYDPVMHPVALHGFNTDDLITRAVAVSANVQKAICFRNPVLALTGGLGHATYVLAPGNRTTELQVLEREDAHPGDFGEAQDFMFEAAKAELGGAS